MMRFDGWQNGMDNVHEDYELSDSTLRRAVNVDITDAGKVRRRSGSTLKLAMSGAHSLWSDNKSIALFVVDNTLKKLLVDGTAAVVGAVNAGLNHLSYVKMHSTVYFSCATAKGRVRDGVLEPWGIETPSSPATLGLGLGNLEPGTYFAAVTYLLADGRESGASVFSKIKLSEAGGIVTTEMPVPLSANVTHKRLYLSTTDGEVLYMAKEGAALDQFFVVDALPTGAELRTNHLSEPPLSTCITEANGRLFMVDALEPRIVWHTEALSFDHVDKRNNYYQFPEPVTLIAGTASGLYVCSDQTYYIGGAGTPESTNSDVFEFIGIAGTAALIPNTNEYIWMTDRGAVIGHDGGNAQLLSASSLAPGSMNNAAAMVREKNGLRQYVAVGNKTEGSTVEAGSYAEAEIIRREA